MFVQEYPTNTFTEVTVELPFILEHRNGEPDVRWPADILLTMSEADLASKGIYPVTPFVPPANYHAVGTPEYHWDNGKVVQIYYDVQPDVVPVPLIISDRQFFQALALMGTITQQEALDAVRTGTIPAQMMLYVNAIPGDVDRFNATMLLSGAVEFRRDHPLVSAFMLANGWTEQQADELWIFAATL